MSYYHFGVSRQLFVLIYLSHLFFFVFVVAAKDKGLLLETRLIKINIA